MYFLEGLMALLAAIATIIFGGWFLFKNIEFLVDLSENYEDGNKLYKCSNCDRYSRGYMKTISYLESLVRRVKDDKDIPEIEIKNDFSYGSGCPHCQNGYTPRASMEFDWINTHPDCKKLNRFQIILAMKRIKKTTKILNNLYSMQEYRKYNKF